MPLFDNLRKMFVRKPEIRMPRRWPRMVMTDTGMLIMPGDQREPVKLMNLSGGGARIRTSFVLPANERVTLSLKLGAVSRHALAAQVVYCQRDPQGLHYDGGLSFVGADRDGIPEVLAFLEDEKQRRFGTKDAWRN
ncbi:MAG TPA: PilZ domain-containing protein [Candidatus Acidoferrales bacterium]|nr:PilZ domain-containing protein [Candidatus Acidoferrales bacterium]